MNIKHHARYKFKVSLLCFMVAYIFAGCTVNPQSESSFLPTEAEISEIHLSLDGAVIDQEGNILESVTVSIDGTRTNYADQYDELSLDLNISDNYRYQILTTIQAPSVSSDSRYLLLEYDVCFGYGYDTKDNELAFFSLGLGTEPAYMILQFECESDQYLVAWGYPVTTPIDVLKYFQDYLDTFAFH